MFCPFGARITDVVLASTRLILALLACAAASAAAAEAPSVAIERLPYKITAHVAIAPEARIDARGRDRLLGAWRGLVRRFVGAPWELTIAGGDRAVAGVDLGTLDFEAVASLAADCDKVWLIQVGREGAAWTLAGRELDTDTQRLGPTYRHLARYAADLPRALLDLAHDLFRPSATIGQASGGGVALTVRGAALPTASPFGQVVAPGTFFRPIRFITLSDGKRRVLDIPFTYLRVESLDGAAAHCAIASGLRDPLTRRIAQKSTLVALGSKPGPHPTRLRFLTADHDAPAAGYRLTARPLPDGAAHDVGTTDREGRIVIPAGEARSEALLELRLLAGSVEPLVEFPLMPGESAQERTIPPFDVRSQTVALESRLDALRDAVVDLVAVRARLEARLKARYDGEDFAGAQAALSEFHQLPSRDAFAAHLARLKDEAAAQQAKTKSAILTRTAQAQLAELDGLITRYLDDEAFRAYAEALAKARADADAAKARGASKATTKPAVGVPRRGPPN
jgi:hypothetical protein